MNRMKKEYEEKVEQLRKREDQAKKQVRREEISSLFNEMIIDVFIGRFLHGKKCIENGCKPWKDALNIYN